MTPIFRRSVALLLVPLLGFDPQLAHAACGLSIQRSNSQSNQSAIYSEQALIAPFVSAARVAFGQIVYLWRQWIQDERTKSMYNQFETDPAKSAELYHWLERQGVLESSHVEIRNDRGVGSGFAVAEDSSYVYILTNSHVVGLKEKVRVKPVRATRSYVGQIIFKHTDDLGNLHDDYALVAIEKSSLRNDRCALTPLRLSSELSVGQLTGQYVSTISGHHQTIRPPSIVRSHDATGFEIEPLENIAEPGDSGSPAVIRFKDKVVIVGVQRGTVAQLFEPPAKRRFAARGSGTRLMLMDKHRLLEIFQEMADTVATPSASESHGYLMKSPKLFQSARTAVNKALDHSIALQLETPSARGAPASLLYRVARLYTTNPWVTVPAGILGYGFEAWGLPVAGKVVGSALAAIVPTVPVILPAILAGDLFILALMGFVGVHRLLQARESRARGEPVDLPNFNKQLLSLLPYALLPALAAFGISGIAFVAAAWIARAMHAGFDIREIPKDIRARNVQEIESIAPIVIVPHQHSSKEDDNELRILLRTSRKADFASRLESFLKKHNFLIQSYEQDIRHIQAQYQRLGPEMGIGIERSPVEAKNELRDAQAAAVKWANRLRRAGIPDYQVAADQLLLLYYGPVLYAKVRFLPDAEIVGVEDEDSRKQSGKAVGPYMQALHELFAASTHGNYSAFQQFEQLSNSSSREYQTPSPSEFAPIFDAMNPNQRSLALKFLRKVETWNKATRLRDERSIIRLKHYKRSLVLVIGANHAERLRSGLPNRTEVLAEGTLFDKSTTLNPVVLGYQGLTFLVEGRYAEAVSRFEQALQLNPNLFELHLELAKAYFGLGNYRAAANGCVAYLAAVKTDSNAQYALAWNLHNAGDILAAEAERGKAVRLYPDKKHLFGWPPPAPNRPESDGAPASTIVTQTPRFRIHGTLIVDEQRGQGVVFYGDHNAGKTTLARLLSGRDKRGRKTATKAWKLMTEPFVQGYAIEGSLVAGIHPKSEHIHHENLQYGDVDSVSMRYVKVPIVIHLEKVQPENWQRNRDTPFTIEETRGISLDSYNFRAEQESVDVEVLSAVPVLRVRILDGPQNHAESLASELERRLARLLQNTPSTSSGGTPASLLYRVARLYTTDPWVTVSVGVAGYGLEAWGLPVVGKALGKAVAEFLPGVSAILPAVLAGGIAFVILAGFVGVHRLLQARESRARGEPVVLPSFTEQMLNLLPYAILPTLAAFGSSDFAFSLVAVIARVIHGVFDIREIVKDIDSQSSIPERDEAQSPAHRHLASSAVFLATFSPVIVYSTAFFIDGQPFNQILSLIAALIVSYIISLSAGRLASKWTDLSLLIKSVVVFSPVWTLAASVGFLTHNFLAVILGILFLGAGIILAVRPSRIEKTSTPSRRGILALLLAFHIAFFGAFSFLPDFDKKFPSLQHISRTLIQTGPGIPLSPLPRTGADFRSALDVRGANLLEEDHAEVIFIPQGEGFDFSTVRVEITTSNGAGVQMARFFVSREISLHGKIYARVSIPLRTVWMSNPQLADPIWIVAVANGPFDASLRTYMLRDKPVLQPGGDRAQLLLRAS